MPLHEPRPYVRKISLLFICFLVAFLPMFLTVVHRVLGLETIGPWIGALAVVNGTVLPFLFYFTLASERNGPGARLAIAFGALVLGVVFSILGMYLFARLALLLEVLVMVGS